MKKSILLWALLLLAAGVQAQVSMTVVGTDGTSTELSVEASGVVYFGTDYMAVMPNAAASSLETFSMDDVRKVLFSGDVRIVDVRQDGDLTLYPNPASESFALRGLGPEPQPLWLYDLDGRLFLQTLCADGQRVDISSLPQGIYLVRAGMSVSKLIKR